jgi:hypothetical protein
MKTSKNSYEAVSKLLNTLGKKLMKKYYGLDVSFDVVDLVNDSSNFRYPYYSVITNPKFPNVLDVKTQDDFEWGKYASVSDAEYALSHLMKYLGSTGDDQIRIGIQNRDNIDELPINEMDYLNHPERFLDLPYVGAVLEKETGMVYALFNDDVIDLDSGNHLSHISEEDFWERLTEEDKQNLNRIYK